MRFGEFSGLPCDYDLGVEFSISNLPRDPAPLPNFGVSLEFDTSSPFSAGNFVINQTDIALHGSSYLIKMKLVFINAAYSDWLVNWFEKQPIEDSFVVNFKDPCLLGTIQFVSGLTLMTTSVRFGSEKEYTFGSEDFTFSIPNCGPIEVQLQDDAPDFIKLFVSQLKSLNVKFPTLECTSRKVRIIIFDLDIFRYNNNNECGPPLLSS